MESHLKQNPSFLLGSKLREIRETLGISSNVFAREAKIDVTEYISVEEGKVPADYTFLKKVVDTYRINPCFLFDFCEIPDVTFSNREEKRYSVRFFTQVRARYLILGKGESWNECTIYDISKKGVGIKFRKGISLGETIHVAITVPKESEPLLIKGVVKWIKECTTYSTGGLELSEELDVDKTLLILRAGT